MKGSIEIYYGIEVVRVYSFKDNTQRKSLLERAFKEINILPKGLKYIDIKYDEPIDCRKKKEYPIQQLNEKGEVIEYFSNMKEAKQKTGISYHSIFQSISRGYLYNKKYYFKKI